MEHIDFLTTLIIVALFLYAIVKQFLAKPIRKFSFVIFPLLALYEAYDSYPKITVSNNQFNECAVIIALAFASAVIQALNTEVFYKDNRLYMRSKIIAVLTWAVYFFVRIGLRFVFNSTGTWIMWLGIAVIFGARSLILLIKYPEIGQALSERPLRYRRRS